MFCKTNWLVILIILFSLEAISLFIEYKFKILNFAPTKTCVNEVIKTP